MAPTVKDIFWSSHKFFFMANWRDQYPAVGLQELLMKKELSDPWFDFLTDDEKQPYEDCLERGAPYVTGLVRPPGKKPLEVKSQDWGKSIDGSAPAANQWAPVTQSNQPLPHFNPQNDGDTDLLVADRVPRLSEEANPFIPAGLSSPESVFQDWWKRNVIQKWMDVGKEQWLAVKALGKGGYGTVVLLVQADANENITKRLARKDAFFEDYELHDWRKWINGVPAEVVLHHRLTATGCEFISRFINWSVNTETNYVTIYMEFEPYGDLRQLNKQVLPGMDPTKVVHKGKSGGKVPLPDAFMWYVAYALFEAAMVMKHGSTTPGSDPNWKSILHRDIKGQNVFLGEEQDISLLLNPDPAKANYAFPYYPRPRLGDFGLAVLELPEGPYRKKHRVVDNMSLKHGYFPPELRKWGDDGPKDISAIDSRANVYQIACALHELATFAMPSAMINDPQGNAVRVYLHSHRRDNTDLLLVEDSSDPNKPKIDEDFKKLIRKCLAFSPENRPSVETAYNYVKQMVIKKNAAPYKWSQIPDPDEDFRAWDNVYPNKLYYFDYSGFRIGEPRGHTQNPWDKPSPPKSAPAADPAEPSSDPGSADEAGDDLSSSGDTIPFGSKSLPKALGLAKAAKPTGITKAGSKKKSQTKKSLPKKSEPKKKA